MGAPGALSISAGLYSRPALTSPMAQLTCLLPNPEPPHIGTKAPPVFPNQRTVSHTLKFRLLKFKISEKPSGLGVPGKPGSGVLSKRLEQLNSRKQRRQGGGVTRSDLGTVSIKKLPPEPEQTSTLGTLSSLLFGRKGGLF